MAPCDPHHMMTLYGYYRAHHLFTLSPSLFRMLNDHPGVCSCVMCCRALPLWCQLPPDHNNVIYVPYSSLPPPPLPLPPGIWRWIGEWCSSPALTICAPEDCIRRRWGLPQWLPVITKRSLIVMESDIYLYLSVNVYWMYFKRDISPTLTSIQLFSCSGIYVLYIHSILCFIQGLFIDIPCEIFHVKYLYISGA